MTCEEAGGHHGVNEALSLTVPPMPHPQAMPQSDPHPQWMVLGGGPLSEEAGHEGGDPREGTHPQVHPHPLHPVRTGQEGSSCDPGREPHQTSLGAP